jgi:hypothetical protein
MLRIALGVIAGLFAWVVVWFGSEKILSAMWPEFGTHQAAFQDAIEHGGPFTADSNILLIHIVLASIVSAIAGFMSAIVSGENKRAPLILGLLLLALGLLKAGMSWPYVPVWYHVLFTAVLLPLTVGAGKLKSSARY